MTDEELIKLAENALNPQKIGEDYVADVGCALISENEEVFTGACIGTNAGICAEQSAVSQMISKGPPKIKKIVAVWKDEQGILYALPPCGICREFLKDLSESNLDTEVILGKDHTVKLKELLPYPGWHAEKL